MRILNIIKITIFVLNKSKIVNHSVKSDEACCRMAPQEIT